MWKDSLRLACWTTLIIRWSANTRESPIGQSWSLQELKKYFFFKIFVLHTRIMCKSYIQFSWTAVSQNGTWTFVNFLRWKQKRFLAVDHKNWTAGCANTRDDGPRCACFFFRQYIISSDGRLFCFTMTKRTDNLGLQKQNIEYRLLDYSSSSLVVMHCDPGNGLPRSIIFARDRFI